MKILAINGARNPQGQTAKAVQAFLDGTAGEGAQSEIALLPPMAIERCRQCNDDGWGICRTEGACVIEDDFAGLLQKIRLADAVVFATPVYYGDLSESLKAFFDRMRRITGAGGKNEGVAEKRAIGICVAGGGGGGAPRCCRLMEGTLQTCGFDVVDMFPARRQNLEAKLARLGQAGAWFSQ